MGVPLPFLSVDYNVLTEAPMVIKNKYVYILLKIRSQIRAMYIQISFIDISVEKEFVTSTKRCLYISYFLSCSLSRAGPTIGQTEWALQVTSPRRLGGGLVEEKNKGTKYFLHLFKA